MDRLSQLERGTVPIKNGDHNQTESETFPNEGDREHSTLRELNVNNAGTQLVDDDTEQHLEHGNKQFTAHNLGLEKENNGSHSLISNAETLAESNDPYTVKWEGVDDLKNPMNWPMSRKWKNMIVISLITFITPLASSMFSPAIPEVMAEFKSNSSTLASFIVSVYLLGFAIGPIFLAPLSELYGRRWVYIICNFLFTIFTIGCAEATSLGMLVAFRFLAGCAGVAPLTLGAGSIADLIPYEHRGKFMALVGIGPLLGPIVGPIAGGYLGEAKGWRWIFYVLTILLAVISIASVFLLDETHAPTLLRHKARKLNKEQNTTQYKSMYHSDLPPKEIFARAIVRPLKMLIFSPIVLLLSLYIAVVYGYLYLLFTTFYVVFQGQYHFSTGSVGLSYIGLGVGSFLGLVIFGFLSDKVYVGLVKKNGSPKPEYRLPLLTYSSWLVPAGFFIYGWTAEKHVHWIVPIMATSLVGLGMLGTFMPIQTYLVDAFTFYAASAMGANTILRSAVGALLPLAGVDMYEKLGLGPGNSLLGGIAVAMIPIPFLFEKYGERIREKFKVNFD